MEERCICCGEIIPEGRQVCKKCEAESYVGEDQVFVNQQRKTSEETARDTRYHVRWPGTMVANETGRSNEMNELLKIYASEVIKKIKCEMKGDMKGAAFHEEAAKSIEKQIEAQDGQPV